MNVRTASPPFNGLIQGWTGSVSTWSVALVGQRLVVPPRAISGGRAPGDRP